MCVLCQGFIREKHGSCFHGDGGGYGGLKTYFNFVVGVGLYFGDFDFVFLCHVVEIVLRFDFLEAYLFHGDFGVFDS